MGKEKKGRNDRDSAAATVLVQAAVESTVVWGLQQQTFIFTVPEAEVQDQGASMVVDW